MARLRTRRGARRAVTGLLRQLPRFLRLLVRLFRDARVSRADKALAALAIAYVLTPADLLPDFLGVFGMVDDLYLLGLALARLLRRAGEEVVLEHWGGSPGALRTLMEGLEDTGDLLPGPVRRALQRTVRRA